MMKLIVCIVMTLTLSNVFGQESNNGKKLWADSFLNKKARNLWWKSGFPNNRN